MPSALSLSSISLGLGVEPDLESSLQNSVLKVDDCRMREASDEISESPFSWSRQHERALRAVIAVYGISLGMTASGPVRGLHIFRQTQTAFGARWFAHNGIDLFFPRVPVFGPRAWVVFEMPWYQAISALLIRIGLAETTALHLSSIAFTCLTAYFVAAITRKVAGPGSALLAALVYLVSPFTIVWGHTTMIESFATAMTLGWILLSIRAINSESLKPLWILAANSIGCVATTTKLTTAFPWLIVLLVMTRKFRLPDFRRIPAVTFAPIVSGLVWTLWADHLKSADVFTLKLTSGATRQFIIGGISERLDLINWLVVGSRSFLITGAVGALLIPFGILESKAKKRLPEFLSICAVIPAALFSFFNLFLVHDYYQSAISPAFAILVASGAGCLFSIKGRIKRNSVAGSLVMLQLSAFSTFGSFAYVSRGFSTAEANSGAELLKVSLPTEQILVTGDDWNPRTLYFGRREGFMISNSDDTKTVLTHLKSIGSPNVLFNSASSVNASKDTLEILAAFPVIASVGVSTYRFGSQFGDVKSGPVPPELIFDRLDTGRQSGPLTDRILCDGFPRVLSKIASTSKEIHIKVTGGMYAWVLTDSKAAPLPVTIGTLHSAHKISTLSCFSALGQTLATVELSA
jgi:hypothetical protein